MVIPFILACLSSSSTVMVVPTLSDQVVIQSLDTDSELESAHDQICSRLGMRGAE